MGKFKITSVVIDYEEPACTFILLFPESYAMRFNCFDWLIYVIDYEEPLSDFIWGRRLETCAEIIGYLDELGFPFRDKLQVFIDHQQKINPRWIKENFRPISDFSE
jgi:hypothetical protein